jgi:type VI secretion system secreted protein Hcp
MPGNSFIKFKEIPTGESTHDSHKGDKGWIELSDWSWDIESDTSFLKGAGASVGKPQPGSMSFTHYYDLASPVIMSKIVQGTAFEKVWVVMLKQTGDKSGKGEPYFAMTMENAFITKVSSKGGEDGSVTQDVEMVFKTIAVGYKPQPDDKKGGLGDQVDFIWDIGKMKTADVTVANLGIQ